jgi:hypothetical protein
MRRVQYLITIDRLCHKYGSLFRALDFEDYCDMDHI